MNYEEVLLWQAIIKQWMESLEQRHKWMKANYPEVEREFQDFCKERWDNKEC